MHKHLHFVTLVLVLAPLVSGCCFYRDRVEVRFKNHEYTNLKAHPEVSMWWEATVGNVDQAGLLYIGERTEGTDSLLQIGFIREPGTMDSVVIKSIQLVPASDGPGANLLPAPEAISFVDDTFPLFDGGSPQGRDVHRDYAELNISTDLLPAHSPYHLTMQGTYHFKDGSTQVFTVEEEITVERVRTLHSIDEAF